MDSLRQWFQDNLDIVFLIYGLAFVVMGIAILVQPKKGSGFRLADILWLLALFGIIHGTNGLLDMWVVIKGHHPALDLIRWFILVISYFFLFEFGRQLFRLTALKSPVRQKKSGKLLVWWLSPLIGCFIFIISFMSVDFWKVGNVWTGYLLCLPGGLLIGFGFFSYYKCEEDILKPLKVRKYFLSISISFLIYGILGGLFVPKGNFFPSNLLNADLFLSTVKIPVQAFRAVCAIVVAWSVSGILKIFNWELRRKFQETQTRLDHQLKENIKLIEELEYLASFPQKNPYPVLECDLNCNITYLNPAAQKLLNELNIKESKLLPSDISETVKSLKTLNKEGIYHELEIGDIVFGEYIHLMPDKERVRIYTVDITETKKAEETLRKKEENLIRQQRALLELSKQKTIRRGELKTALKEITEASSKLLDVERVNVWLFNEDHTKIRCIDSYEKSKDKHSEGDELTVEDYPAYFKALKEGRTIAAHDAYSDPRTTEFSQSYLSPHNIKSMLDAPLRLGGEVIGVICHEHVGHDKRTWTVEEQNFAGSIADLISLAIEAFEHRRTGEKLKIREHQQAVVSELGRRALAGIDTNELMEESVAVVAETLGVEYCKILELLPEGNTLLLRAGVGWRKELIGHATVGAGTDSQAGYTLLCNEPVIVEDLHTESRFSGPPLLHEHGIVSGMSVIIRGKEQPFGVLSVHTIKRRTFTEEDINFLQAVANILAEAIDRKQMEEKVRRNYESQRVINSLLSLSLKDIPLEEFLNRTLDLILSIPWLSFESRGSIFLVEDEPNILIMKAQKGLPKPIQRECARIPIGRCLCGQAALTQKIQFTDSLDSRHEIQYEGIVSHGHYCVPILFADKLLGVINIYLTEGHRYDEKEEEFLNVIANTLAGLIQRKQTERELVRHTMELLSLADSSNVISAVLLTENLYEAICNVATKNFDIKMVWLGLIEKESYDVKPIAQSGFDNGYLSSVKITWDNSPYGMGPTGMAIKTRAPRVMNDIDTDPTYAPWRAEALKRGYRSSMALPLIDSEGEVMGVINLYSSKPQFFTKKRVNLFKVFANYAAVAIENRLLIEGLEEKVRKRTKELEEYGFKLQKLYELSFTTKANVKEFAKMMLEEVTRMLNVGGAAVGRIIGDEWVAYTVVDHKGFGIKEGMRLPLKELYCKIISDTKRPLVINDTSVSEEFKEHPYLLKHKIVSYLGVPVFIGDEFFGILCTFCKSPHYYTEYDLILHQLLSKRLEFEFIKEKYENELREAMMQAQAANKAKSDFLLNMSHELRTPLNAIIGFSEMMIEGLAGRINKKQKEYLTDILESGKHLLSLISDILDLSKIEAGRTELELSEFNLGELLEGSLAMFKEKAIKHRIKIEIEIDKRIETIVADERKIKQIMFNLLSNAMKFTPDGGNIYIQARLVQMDEIEISVEDTGIGISKEDMSKLFQPFQQLGSPLTKRYEGTGLGLSLCKKFVELHGGRIWAESEVGKGSRFMFTIPIRQK